MKKLSVLPMFLCAAAMSAQTVPNGNFEAWDEIVYAFPDDWNNSNAESVPQLGLITASEVPGFSGSAIRIETVGGSVGIAMGFVSNTFSDPLAGEGGQAYSQQPEAFGGYYRYNLPGLDTALVLLIFKKDGAVVSTDLFKIRNESGVQSDFIPFSFPLSLNEVPDSVIVAAASSNGITEEGIEVGSWLELDELHFTGAGITQEIINGDFEDWTDQYYYNPDEWERFGAQIERVGDAYDGQYALYLRSYGDGDEAYPSGVTTGRVLDMQIVGGQPYTAMQDTLTGYYKYLTPSIIDRGLVSVYLTNDMTPAGSAYIQLAPASEYTYFEIPFLAFSQPDTLRVDIMSSSWPFENASEESELIVDRIQLKSEPLRTTERILPHWKLYPNPASHFITLERPAEMKGNVRISVFDSAGRLVPVQPMVAADRITVPLDQLSPGLYVIEFSDGERIIRETFVRR
jgi:hypothetical protein